MKSCKDLSIHSWFSGDHSHAYMHAFVSDLCGKVVTTIVYPTGGMRKTVTFKLWSHQQPGELYETLTGKLAAWPQQRLGNMCKTMNRNASCWVPFTGDFG